MIGWLQGIVVDRELPNKIVLSVQGVGYDVEILSPTYIELERVTTSVILYIHTIVREDAFLLFGFLTKHERALFRILMKVSGIGPKLAMTILSSTPVDDLIYAIQKEDINALSSIPGIGKKTAARMVVELTQCVADMMSFSPVTPQSNSMKYTAESEAVSALEALGYKLFEAKKAVQKVNDGQKSSEMLIRQALQMLSSV